MKAKIFTQAGKHYFTVNDGHSLVHLTQAEKYHQMLKEIKQWFNDARRYGALPDEEGSLENEHMEVVERLRKLFDDLFVKHQIIEVD